MDKNIVFYECGCCGHYHQEGFVGDCREDSQRFTLNELEEDRDGGTPIKIIDLEQQMEVDDR